MEIQVATTAAQARALRDAGCCPVECAFGAESIVDELGLDHHGDLSMLEPVSIRAFRDHYGRRTASRRFVVTGAPDADASFAIAVLGGVLPPQDTCSNAAPADLARLIAERDVAPLGMDLTATSAARLLLLFDAVRSREADPLAWTAAVNAWRWLLTAAAAPALAEVCAARDAERRRLGREAEIVSIDCNVAVVFSGTWAFDVWCLEAAPIVLRHDAASGLVMIGCRDAATARQLLGPQGLKAVYDRLEPAGWGGRETVGGSPRGRRISRDEALNAGRIIARSTGQGNGAPIS